MKKIVSLLLVTALIIGSPVKADCKETYYSICCEVGDIYGICPEILQAMCFYESSYNPKVHNSYDATGLMGIVPRFNRSRMKRLGITDLYDPKQNIMCGADLMLELCEKYGDCGLALVAYNCGENSKTFKSCLKNGTYTRYAQKILDMAWELEESNGKHTY